MKKSKKILSALLAMTMLFSVMSIGVDAVIYEYKDSAIASYDTIDKPILSTNQYGSMLLDEVDRMLAEENIKETIDLGGLAELTIDATSIDKARESVISLWGSVEPLLGLVGGDVKDIDMSALVDDWKPRDAAGVPDIEILYCLFQFLSDNSGIIKKAANNTLNLGMLANFVDFELDIQQMIKEMLYEMAYPEQEVPDNITETVDQMVQDLIDLMLMGELDPETGEYDGFFPELSGHIDLDGQSFYDLIEEGFRIFWNDMGVELFNTKVKKYVREMCGVVYSEEYPQGDTSNLNEYAELINIDFTIPEIDFSQYGENESFIDNINDIFGMVFEEVAIFPVTWVYGDNSYLLSNIVTAGKEVVKMTGSAFFADYVDVKTPQEIDSMTDMEFITYVVRSTVNGSDTGINVPDSIDTLLELAVFCAKVAVSDMIPAQYNSYKSLPLNDTQSLETMLSDVIVYYAKQYTNAFMFYGTPLHDSEAAYGDRMKSVMDWVDNNYGGFLSSVSASSEGWDAVNEIFFSLFPAEWLPLKDGVLRDDVYDLLFNDVLYNLINLDFDALFDLLHRNPNPGEGLNNTVTNILVNYVKNIINFILPNTATLTYTSFEDLISETKLPTLVENLLNNLNANVRTIMPSLIPILCSSLGLSSEQEFAFPYVSLPTEIDGAESFYIYNQSSGLNTGYRVINGNTLVSEQDRLYKYRILDITTNQPGVTVKYNGQTIGNISGNLDINGGEMLYFDISGTPANNETLVVTIELDVLDEFGQVLTADPIVHTSYTFVTTSEDDGSKEIKLDATTANYHYLSYKKVSYLNQNTSLSKLGDYSITLRRDAEDGNVHSYPAVFTQSTNEYETFINSDLLNADIALNSFSQINTTVKGGMWSVEPYDASAVTEETVRPADGMYSSAFTYKATKSSQSGSGETLSFDHYVYLYNDYDLPSLVSGAIKANRQPSQYNQGYYEYTYIDDYGVEQTEMVNGAAVWSEYIDAIADGVSVVYRPRNVNTFSITHQDKYEQYAENLEEAIAKLEAGVEASGGSSLKTTLEAYDPQNYTIEIDPETSEEIKVPLDYYDPNYRYIDDEDYLIYTYLRFKPERNAARSIINKLEADEPEVVSAIEMTYAEHRVDLYGSRLIRVRAYTGALADEIANVDSMNYLEADYTAESWERFENAYNFAVATAAEDIGTYLSNGVLTSEDGLRQSKVNKAREELVEASKKLVTSADYSELNDAIATAQGIVDETLYTVATWTVFADAKQTALDVPDDLLATIDDQQIIDDAAGALIAAINGLEFIADYSQLDVAIADAEDYIADEELYTTETFGDLMVAYNAATAIDRDLSTSGQSAIDDACNNLVSAIGALEYAEQAGVKPIDGTTVIVDNELSNYYGSHQFIYGLNPMWPSVTGLLEPTGGSSVNIIPNSMGVESTGAVVEVSASGQVVAAYEVILFGDIDGDGSISGNDISEIENMCHSKGTLFEQCYGLVNVNAYSMACDINADGSIDANDATYSVSAHYGNGYILQEHDPNNFFYFW